MITTRALAIGAFITLGLTVAVSGHHSFAAFYFEDQSIQIEGDIVEVQYKACGCTSGRRRLPGRHASIKQSGPTPVASNATA